LKKDLNTRETEISNDCIIYISFDVQDSVILYELGKLRFYPKMPRSTLTKGGGDKQTMDNDLYYSEKPMFSKR
jgi:hypothetical protein